TDAAILEIEDIKKDLPCTVTQIKPILGFDMRFHTGYDITLPLRELEGDGNQLTIVFKATSDTAKDSPVYFSQRYNVPSIEDDAKGDAYLQGGFDVGEGNYHVSWMMRDRMERVCSSNWDTTATLQGKEQAMKLTIAANAIEASNREFFSEEPPVTRLSSDPLKVKILVNFAPQKSESAAMAPIDTSALVSILRSISREPRICKFSVVAFNMNDQKVVYRKEDADQIDFPALGKALSTIKLGMVDYKKLSDKHSETDFLTKLIQQEVGNAASTDALIFAGPKVMLDQDPPQDALKDIANVNFPVFYMNYVLTPQQTPWRDSIGNVVKKMRGYEYTISRPRDLWMAWSDIMSRIVKLKLVGSAPASSQ
ncbi:MAG: acetyltransferase, partial [Acidobacteriota bacterium]|nr:acetyltransferase [Acidobacteriota bacterium]